MKIKIAPSRNNTYPLSGILIRGNSPSRWLKVVDKLAVDLNQVSAFAIPSNKANELYGCLLVTSHLTKHSHLANVLFFQCIHNSIFIPEYAAIHPLISKIETNRVFKTPHVYHPDFGWFAMEKPINWINCIKLNDFINIEVIKPMLGTVIPKHIYKIGAIPKDEKEIEKDLDLPLKKISDDDLTTMDKLRLGLFKTLFSSRSKSPGQFDVKEKGFLKLLNRWYGNRERSSRWGKSMDALLQRNSKEADRLLAMFAKNPKLAMKFAIPLDLIGASRDSGKSLLSLSGRNKGTSGPKQIPLQSLALILAVITSVISFVLRVKPRSGSSDNGLGSLIAFLLIGFIIYSVLSSLFKTTNNSGGTATIHDDRMEALRKQYLKIIEAEKKEGNYRKAAAMQIKLLNNHWEAASTLEEGRFYEEAAFLHIKYTKSKYHAAELYAKGQFYDKAISIHKELKNYENVGDLYKESGNIHDANEYFQMVIDNHLQSNNYLKAAAVYKEKLEDLATTQSTLLRGWRSSKQQSKCLKEYFNNITDPQIIEKELLYFYKNETNAGNIRLFIKELKAQKDKTPELQTFSKNIIYKIISSYYNVDPGISFELGSFDEGNKRIHRDSNIFVREHKKHNKNKPN
ncbi:MAG: hypothetical protein ACSHWW_05155 [Nonlabens sp.]|uniref:hypothetical protein n=1 Tax=Nonlabens sp. TaxID=1888209 RepID=UPI003EF663FF